MVEICKKMLIFRQSIPIFIRGTLLLLLSILLQRKRTPHLVRIFDLKEVNAEKGGDFAVETLTRVLGKKGQVLMIL